MPSKTDVAIMNKVSDLVKSTGISRVNLNRYIANNYIKNKNLEQSQKNKLNFLFSKSDQQHAVDCNAFMQNSNLGSDHPLSNFGSANFSQNTIENGIEFEEYQDIVDGSVGSDPNFSVMNIVNSGSDFGRNTYGNGFEGFGNVSNIPSEVQVLIDLEKSQAEHYKIKPEKSKSSYKAWEAKNKTLNAQIAALKLKTLASKLNKIEYDLKNAEIGLAEHLKTNRPSYSNYDNRRSQWDDKKEKFQKSITSLKKQLATEKAYEAAVPTPFDQLPQVAQEFIAKANAIAQASLPPVTQAQIQQLKEVAQVAPTEAQAQVVMAKANEIAKDALPAEAKAEIEELHEQAQEVVAQINSGGKMSYKSSHPLLAYSKKLKGEAFSGFLDDIMATVKAPVQKIIDDNKAKAISAATVQASNLVGKSLTNLTKADPKAQATINKIVAGATASAQDTALNKVKAMFEENKTALMIGGGAIVGLIALKIFMNRKSA